MGSRSEYPIVKKQPVLITDAARSQNDQFRSRQIRYVTMMGMRAACLVLGAILISVKPPLLPLWLILCAAGMVFLPWAAVLIANDRPPKSKAERAADSAQAEKQQAVLAQHSAEEVEYLTIDAESDETGDRWIPEPRASRLDKN
jgi:arginine exporter protein ArgO